MNGLFDILAVDDEPIVVAAVKKTLKPEGLSVDTAGDVSTATQKLKASTYRVVLCDLMLPGPSGLALIEVAKRLEPAPPVIIMTGYATLENAVESFRVGAFDCLPKPFDVNELLGVVQRASRYFESVQEGGVSTSEWVGDDNSIVYTLGIHSWASVAADGVTLGMGPAFAPSIDFIAELKLPASGEEVWQGKACAEIRTREGAFCRVWSPLSGRVVDINRRVLADPREVEVDPAGDGWLLRLAPNDLEGELVNLARRDSTGG